MPQESTLLSFVAQRHTIGLEDVATDALSFILSRSASARQALAGFLADGYDPLPIAKVQTWMTDAHGAIPDLACLDDNDNTVALIESKFWAPLTPHQPVTYWEELPTNARSVLLFLAPDYRVDQGTLWDELESKLRDAGHELGPDNSKNGLITALSKDGQRRLMLTTWQQLLECMAHKAKEDGDSRACFEIAELQGLAASAIKGDRPTRDENLKRLIAEAIKQAEHLGWADTKGLSVGQGHNYYGRYLYIAGVFAWLGIHYRFLKQMPGKPLWLFFGDDTADAAVKFEKVFGRLKDLAETGIESGGGLYLPIAMPAGADRAQTLDAIVSQLGRIADLIDPERQHDLS